MYFSLKNNLFFSKKCWFLFLPSLGLDILDMIDDIVSKTQDIPSKLVSFNSIRLTLQVDLKNMYLWLKNKLLFSKKRRHLCLSPTEHDILAMIDDNS